MENHYNFFNSIFGGASIAAVEIVGTIDVTEIGKLIIQVLIALITLINAINHKKALNRRKKNNPYHD